MKKPVLYEPGKPINRFQMLGNILRRHLSEVMLVSLYCFLFSLPLLGWVIFSINVDFLRQDNAYAILIVDGVGALLLGVLGLSFAGGMLFFKKLIFGEGASLKEDFAQGIRRNGGLFFLIFLVMGALYLLLHLGLGITAGMEIDGVWKSVLAGVEYAVFFLLCFVHLFMLSEATMFEGGYFSLLVSSFRLCFASLLKGLPIYLMVMLPLLLFEFLPFPYFNLAGVLVGAFFHFGFSLACLTLFCNHVYDRSVFKTQYPELYRKGLAKEAGEGEKPL